IKDYTCEHNRVASTAAARRPAQFTTANFSANSNMSEAKELFLVKNLPDFRVGQLRLFTERNLRRYMEFKNLSITAKRSTYNFQSDLGFSPSLNVGSLPTLNITGSFDQSHNIQITSRLREARMDLK